jgi:hypothetical protein
VRVLSRWGPSPLRAENRPRGIRPIVPPLRLIRASLKKRLSQKVLVPTPTALTIRKHLNPLNEVQTCFHQRPNVEIETIFLTNSKIVNGTTPTNEDRTLTAFFEMQPSMDQTLGATVERAQRSSERKGRETDMPCGIFDDAWQKRRALPWSDRNRWSYRNPELREFDPYSVP